MAEVTAAEFKIFGRDGTSDNFGKVGSARAGLAVNTKVISTIQALAAWLNGLQDAVNTTKKAPYIEEMNSILYVFSTQIAHLLEKGIAEWETTRTYYTSDIVKKNATTELYGSIGGPNTGNALPNKVDDSNWKYLGILGQRADGSNDGLLTSSGYTKLAGISAGANRIYISAVTMGAVGVSTSGTISGTFNPKTGATTGSNVGDKAHPTNFPAGITVVAIAVIQRLGFNTAGDMNAYLNNGTNKTVVAGTSDDTWTMKYDWNAGSAGANFGATYIFIGIQ